MRGGGWIIVLAVAALAALWLFRGNISLALAQSTANGPISQSDVLGAQLAPPSADADFVGGSTIDSLPLDDPYADGTLSLPTFDPVLTNG